ncbi:MAG: hypothetical protein IT438_16535 [Phycisphaerales bacterium]|nr:hypothetical protein [Phycisphaerales bacterium]
MNKRFKRSMEIREPGGPAARLTIEIGLPGPSAEDPRDHVVSYSITKPGIDRSGEAHGADALDAMVIATHIVGRILADMRIDHEITWLGEPYLRLPGCGDPV